MFRRESAKVRLASHACTFRGCNRVLSSAAGLQRHISFKHTIPHDLQPPEQVVPPVIFDFDDFGQDPFDTPSPPAPGPPDDFEAPLTPRQRLRNPQPNIKYKPGGIVVETHPILDGTPCDIEGNDLDEGSPPPPYEDPPFGDYSPFVNRAMFEFAEFLYTDVQMSAAKIDRLLHLLACLHPDDPPQSARARHIYSLIDQIQQGDVAWDSFTMKYNGNVNLPEG
ncbi:hypothetical protein H0H92_015755, partial [Tricholoma furcatifolium]